MVYYFSLQTLYAYVILLPPYPKIVVCRLYVGWDISITKLPYQFRVTGIAISDFKEISNSAAIAFCPFSGDEQMESVNMQGNISTSTL